MGQVVGSYGPAFLARLRTAYFFCDKLGDTPLPAPFSLGQSTGPESAKACADGADAELVTLHLPFASNASNVQVRVKEDPTGVSPGIYGHFSTPVLYDDDSIGVRYVHPSTPPPSGQPFLPMTLQAYDPQSGQPVFECPISMYRAPVLFVHGIWSNSGAFDDMMATCEGFGSYPRSLLSAELADYSARSSYGFKSNDGVVPGAIKQELRALRSAGYAAAKVDIVAHSMGALLTRLYLQSSYLDAQPYRGDINRLITFNAPHWGSQCANLLLDTRVPLHDYIVDGFRKNNKAVTLGAVDNLRVDSDEIVTLLNGPGIINHAVVPTHVVTTRGGFGDQHDEDHFTKAYRTAALPLLMSKEALVSQIFGGDANDLVVAVHSQQGGLSSECVSSFTHQLHTESAGNGSVILDILSALDAPADESGVWTLDGFAFTQLPYNLGLMPFSQPVASARAAAGSMSILAPVDGAVVAPGAQVSVSTSGSPDVARILVIVYCSSDGVPAGELTGPSATWSFTVPQAAIGNLVIQSFGLGADGSTVVGASVTVNVSTTAALDSIEARPSSHDVTVGSQFGETLYGHYHDGIMRCLLGVSGVSIQSSNPAIVHAVALDSIVAVAAGTATLTLAYEGRTVTVPVTVSAADVTGVPLSELPTNAGHTRILSIAPNPSRGRVGLQFELGPQGGVTRLEVFDITGRRIKQVIAGVSLSVGVQTATWDGTADGGASVAAGMYYARLQVGFVTAIRRFIFLR
jgi:hypothetical protein